MNKKLIKEQIQSKILLLRRCYGNDASSRKPISSRFWWEEDEGCNEYLTITRPDVIQKVHEKYLEAGADH